MRETTINTYNPTGTAALFGILAAAILAGILALFTWHPWYVTPPGDPGTTTNVNQQTNPQQPQPAPQST